MYYNNTSTSIHFQVFFGNGDDGTILSSTQTQLFIIVSMVCLTPIIGVFGILSNITNIVVFIKQGFTNTVNISFLGIAISDLCCVLATEWNCLYFNPDPHLAIAPWISSDFVTLTGAWPHMVSGRITSYITVYITAERCMCIIAPLKVKEIMTPRRTKIAVFLIYFVNILTVIHECGTSYPEWKFFPDRNRTILSVSFTSDRKKVETLTFALTTIAGFLSFLAVIFFTTVLVVKLKQSSEWRKKATSGSDQSGPMSKRDKKIVKMIVFIAAVLIACYTPGVLLTLTTVFEPEFLIGKKFSNMACSMWSIAFVFETTNASVNIFLYYKMSSNYRETLHKIFTCEK